jgi:hypothetical protein
VRRDLAPPENGNGSGAGSSTGGAGGAVTVTLSSSPSSRTVSPHNCPRRDVRTLDCCAGHEDEMVQGESASARIRPV